MRATILILLATAVIAFGQAPSPMTVVVPAMTPATVVKTAADNPAGSSQNVLKALLAMKAANEEILKQQAATLQKLDEMEKAAQEIRIFTKRN